MKKLTILPILIFLLSGCATLNFSSKYYTLPVDYKKDIDEVWDEILLKIPLKYKNSYSYKISKDKETRIAGTPQIYNGVIYFPEYFIKYVWEFYYPNYHKDIIGCVFAHELGHPESGYSDNPPEQHLLCDKYSISNLILPAYTSSTYYSTLIVVRDYWSARKGAGGHLANAGYNTLIAALIIYGGSGSFYNWFATDLNNRISALKSEYSAKFVFKRSK